MPSTRFARDMLAIADNFGRALAACRRNCAKRPIRRSKRRARRRRGDGTPIARRRWSDTASSRSTRRAASSIPICIRPIAEVPGEGKPAGTIVNVVQTGYMIGERLLRPAMVTVARKESSNGVDTKV